MGESALKPAPFGYAKATSVDHAVALLSQYADGRLLAGGQSLIATLNMRLSAPRLLIDINPLDELKSISRDADSLSIGALVRHAEAERSDEIARHAPLIALANPAAELPACLLALGGEGEIANTGGTRRVGADDFFKGLFETALGPGDVLTAVRIPVARAESRFGFAELARRHGDYALVGLAAAARADGKALRDVRLAFFGVGATALRARNAEAAVANGADPVAALARDL